MRKAALAGGVVAVLAIAVTFLLLVRGPARHVPSEETAARVADLARVCELARPASGDEKDIVGALRSLGYRDPAGEAARLLGGGEPIEVIVILRNRGHLAYAVAAYDSGEWGSLERQPLAKRLARAKWVHFEGEWVRTQDAGRARDSATFAEVLRMVGGGD